MRRGSAAWEWKKLLVVIVAGSGAELRRWRHHNGCGVCPAPLLVPHAPFLLYILPYGTQTVPVRWARAPALATREIVTQRDLLNHRSQPATEFSLVTGLSHRSQPPLRILTRDQYFPSLATGHSEFHHSLLGYSFSHRSQPHHQ